MEWVRGECLGYGSSSTVQLATPRSPSSSCPPLMAIKSCNLSDTTLLQNEMEILNKIGLCPQIIQCFGHYYHTMEETYEPLYSLLLEYAKGGSLFSKLKKSGGCLQLQENDVKNYTRSILKGLHHIHTKGFVHCDLKLENILLFENDKLKIADFGLAKKAGQKQRKVEIRGTPLYMAPESVNNNDYESGVDIWALGCAIVEMMTGKPAWNHKPGTNMFSLLMRIGASDELPTIPEELSHQGKDFLSKCFVKDPAKRWTADMLLVHPFVADQVKATVPSEEEGVRQSASPRCHFDFSEWASIQSSTPRSECWSDEKGESIFSSLKSSCWSSGPDRIRKLASDRRCDWLDSGCWVTIR